MAETYAPIQIGPVHYLGPAHPLQIPCRVHRRGRGEACYGQRSVCAARDIANIKRVAAQDERERSAKEQQKP